MYFKKIVIKLYQNKDPIQRLLAAIRPLLDFTDFTRDDSDLAWLEAKVPISAFAFPNFTRHTTMSKWIESSQVKVKGLIGSRSSLPLHVVPEVITDTFIDLLEAPAVLPWAENPVNVGWKRFWSISTPIFNFLEPWDNLTGPAGEVTIPRWIFFPRHRVNQGVTIWANYNLRDIPTVNDPTQGWSDPQVSIISEAKALFFCRKIFNIGLSEGVGYQYELIILKTELRMIIHFKISDPGDFESDLVFDGYFG